MAFAATFQRLRASLVKSAGTVVFGMEDGTVSIFGLIFGVAATTKHPDGGIAGASGAVAAAVSMMAGVYLDAETTMTPWRRNARGAVRPDVPTRRHRRSASGPARRGRADRRANGCAGRRGAGQSGSLVRAPCRARSCAGGNCRIPGSRPYGMLADFAAAAVPIVRVRCCWRYPQARVVSGAVSASCC